MAIRHSITLSTTEPNNEVGIIKIRQADEQTQMLDAQITAEGVPKSYQGLAVYFCAKLGQTAGLGIIEQKLNPEEMTDPTNGKLEYTMRAEDWQILGRQRGYFSFRKMKDEHEFVEQFTTRDFTFDVIKSVYSDGLKEVKKDGSTYVWTIEDMVRLFKEYIATGKTDWEGFVEQNREILESVDPGGELLSEIILARGEAYATLGDRLDSDKIEVSAQLSQITTNVKTFGAIGDGISDDTKAFQDALDYIKDKGQGGSLHVPAGIYKITQSLNYSVMGVKSLKIMGEGERASEIRWYGGSGIMFTNEKTGINQHEYGLTIRDLSITARFDGQTSIPLGSTGLYIDMTHDWIIDNVHINGFEKGVEIGVHSDNGKISDSKFQYNGIALEAYGDQTDNLVVSNTWFTASKTRAVELSSPRATFRNCMFIPDSSYSNLQEYVDVQIGHKVIKDRDKNKSTYMQTSTGNGGSYANIIDCNFEGAGVVGQPAIFVENFTGDRVFPGLNIDNNYFALYDRNCVIKLNVEKSYFTTSNNKMSSSLENSFLIDYNTKIGGPVVFKEPFIRNVFKDRNQKWRFGATKNEFDKLEQLANVVTALGAWTPNNPSFNNGVRMGTDYDGLGKTKITLDNSPAQSVVMRLTLTNCPVGMIYFSTAFKASANANMFVSTHRGSGQSIYRLANIPLTSHKKDLVFGFHNDTVSTMVIDFTLSQPVTSGEVVFDEVLIKHENNQPQSFLLLDTKSGVRFTRRTGQMFDIPNKIPYVDVLDYDNVQNGAIYFGDHSFTEILMDGGYLTGEKIINVRDATKIKVGEHLFFRRLVNNVDVGYQGKQNTGNKVVSVVGNVITLEEGIPFAVSNESKVMSCKVFKKPNTTVM